MNLRPEDLGEAWHLTLTRRRAGGEESRDMNRLERYWTDGMGLSEPLARASRKAAGGGIAAALALTSMGSIALESLLSRIAPGLGMAIAGVAVSGGLGILALHQIPRGTIRQIHEKPITDQEIAALLKVYAGPSAGYAPMDPITDFVTKLLGVHAAPPPVREIGPEEAYLALVRELIRLEGLSVDSEASLKDTLRTLGAAVSSLPEILAPEVDPADLVAEARQILRRAEIEHDRIVEASLVRQARALVDQSRAVERTLTLARRTRVLRRELLAQIESLRAAIPSFTRAATAASEANAHFGSVQRVAESVRGVAREAASVADAREELAVSLDPSWRTTHEAAPMLRVGRRG